MTTYQATNHAQMANFIHGFTCIQSPFSQTRTKPEPDPKPGFSKKAPGLESLVATTTQTLPQLTTQHKTPNVSRVCGWGAGRCVVSWRTRHNTTPSQNSAAWNRYRL